MKLEAIQNDFNEIKNVWEHYWNKEIIKRPPVVIRVWEKVEKENIKIDYWEKRYYYANTHKYKEALKQIELILDNVLYMGEALPFFSPDFGPDQFSAFLGAELEFSQNSPETNWVSPVIDNWKKFSPLQLKENSKVWQGVLEYAKILKNNAKEKFLIGVCDFHSNVDTLVALRGAEKFCMDLYDSPDLIKDAMNQVIKIYKIVYNKLYEISGFNHETGTIGWLPLWSSKKFAVIQADYITLISPEFAKEFVIPALEAEAEFLDNSFYHLDGPGALPHLDNILSIKKIFGIQWVPGAGQPPMYKWMDLIKKIQNAGKGIIIQGIDNIEIVKKIHKELNPIGVVYHMDLKSRKDAEEIIKWLENNT